MKKKKLFDLNQMIQEKYSENRINLFYDTDNLDNCTQNLTEVIENLNKIIDILNKDEKELQLCIRIHCYKKWVIVRIIADIKQEKCFEEKIRSVFCGDLISFASDEHYQIIKLCYSES